MEEDAEQESPGWFSSWIPSWCPTSVAHLKAVEGRILSGIRSRMESRYVRLKCGERIWTVSLSPEEEEEAGCPGQSSAGTKTPLVLVHGFGGGLGLWVQNMEGLCGRRPVHAFDLLGFGRSSRPRFPADPEEVEGLFVHSIEDWREELGLSKMVLLGHSLGGFLAASYTIQHPDRVKHLILVDPWGFPERPADLSETWKPPMWVKAAAAVLGRFNFLAILRAAGPWGPSLVQRFRPDLKQKYSNYFTDDTILEYVYHCNAQTPSGEVAFKVLSESFGWAKRPMLRRVHLIPKEVPITLIYGSRSWIEPSSGERVKSLRPHSYVQTMSIEGASHHVYADRPEEFNAAVLGVCESIPDSPAGPLSAASSSPPSRPLTRASPQPSD